MLYPGIRFCRAISAVVLFPEHLPQAVATSEVISVIGPMLNPNYFSTTIGYMLAIVYQPSFASHILKKKAETNMVYKQAEICLILLFLAYMLIKI